MPSREDRRAAESSSVLRGRVPGAFAGRASPWCATRPTPRSRCRRPAV